MRASVQIPYAVLINICNNAIQYALDHEEDALEYAMQYSRGKSRDLISKFVKMYVNPVTVNMGTKGEESTC